MLGQVEEFFQPNPSWWVKKNSTQPMWIELGWVRPIGWTVIFFNYYYYY